MSLLDLSGYVRGATGRARKGAVVLALVTKALREDSPDVLRSGLAQFLRETQTRSSDDLRDLMVALAPFHDCSRRLGLDAPAVFDQAAAAGPSSLASAVREFGRRADITPDAFGFAVEDTPAGAEYRWV